MRVWGSRSRTVYDELDPRLQKVMDRVLQEVADISLICGHRGEKAQNDAYNSGHSQVRWPYGKHNKLPSIAVDVQPYPYPARTEQLWAALAYVAGAAIQIGKQEGITLRWGGDWNQNGSLTDNNFNDLFHLEIVD